MILLRSANLAAVDEVGDDAREALVDEAMRFRLAGGVVSPSDWLAMEECERDALVAAGLRLRLDRITEQVAS